MPIKFLKRETQILKNLEITAKVLRKGLNDFIVFRLKQNIKLNKIEQRIENIENKLGLKINEYELNLI